jgi:hypothetical protein
VTVFKQKQASPSEGPIELRPFGGSFVSASSISFQVAVVGSSGSSNSSDDPLLLSKSAVFRSRHRARRAFKENVGRMLTLLLTLLAITIVLGATLLIPQGAALVRISRRRLAATHGICGAFALVVVIWRASAMAQVSQPTWFAIALVSAGLIVGIMIFVTCRHRRRPSALLLALHIVFAGIGALLVAALLLS